MIWLIENTMTGYLQHNSLVCISVLVTSLSIFIATILAVQVITLKQSIKNLKKMEEQLRYCSEYDTLSALKNRNGFANCIANLTWDRMTVLVCDIDNLKMINDTLGHLSGDKLIQRAASLLQKVCPKGALFFRMGGDEFFVLLPDVGEVKGIEVYNKLKKELQIIKTEGAPPLSLSVGVASGSRDQGDTINSIIQEADYLMYKEKRQHHIKELLIEKKESCQFLED